MARKSAAIDFTHAFQELRAEQAAAAEETRNIDAELAARKQRLGTPKQVHPTGYIHPGTSEQVHLDVPEQVHPAPQVHLDTPEVVHLDVPKADTNLGTPEQVHPDRYTQLGTPEQIHPFGYTQIGTSNQVYQNGYTNPIRLSESKRRVLAAFVALEKPGFGFVTNMQKVSHQFGIPWTTVRNAYYFLVSTGILEPYKDAAHPTPHNHINVRVNLEKFPQYGITMEDIQVYLNRYTKLGTPNQVYPNGYTQLGTPSLVHQNGYTRTGTSEQVHPGAPLRETDNAEKSFFLNISQEDLEDCWPNLARQGFTPQHCLMVASKRDKLGIGYEDIKLSLEYANAHAAEGGAAAAADKPLGYLVSALSRGSVLKPGGYKTHRERQLETLKAEVAAELAAQKEMEDLTLDLKVARLTPEEREAAINAAPGHPEKPEAIQRALRAYVRSKC